MRMLIKWCSELESSLESKNLFDRVEPCPLTNGKEKPYFYSEVKRTEKFP